MRNNKTFDFDNKNKKISMKICVMSVIQSNFNNKFHHNTIQIQIK